MKTLITIATLSLLTAPAFAGGVWKDNLDTAGHILSEDRPAYVGTGMSDQGRQEVKIYGSLVSEDIQDGFKVGNAERENGRGDQYGSVLHDVDTPF